MRLVRIAKVQWEVLAVLDGRNGSVWSWLEDRKSDRHVNRMQKRIRRRVPREGAPRHPFHGTILGDGVGEFRTGPENGPKLRVLYFYAKGKRIICTEGFWKKTETAPDQIKRAERLKRKYLGAIDDGTLRIIDLDELEKEKR